MTHKLTIEDVPEMLHDAWLTRVAWDADERALLLEWEPLRRGPDESILETPVQTTFQGVRSILLSVAPDDPFINPAEIGRPAPFSVDAITCEPDREGWIGVTINDTTREFWVQRAPYQWWLFGDAEARSDDANVLVLPLEGDDIGLGEEFSADLLVVFDSVEVTSGGEVLSLEEWAHQYNAWWDGWKKYWDEKRDSSPTETEAAYETAIPVATSEPDQDTDTYEPPSRPAFELEETDIPDELLEPLRDYFEGHVAGNLERVARSETIDADIPRQLDQLQSWNEREGSWEYARSVEQWWQDGDRAAVTVWGIEHWGPIDGEPPEDWRFKAKFALQKACGRWIIRSWSKGRI